MERRLAAILAADVVGYSRLVEADEESAIEGLKTCREAIQTLVDRHSGRAFGGAGDSIVAEFASPVEAVRCAAAIQQDAAERNAGLPEDRGMKLRIGINLGDVIVDDDNLLGDGVNVAARLESLAGPGAVYISHAVYDQVHKQLPFGFDYLGEQQVKNIAEPIPVYQVNPDDSSTDGRSFKPRPLSHRLRWSSLAAAIVLLIAGAGTWWIASDYDKSRLSEKPSIAVLSLDTFSDEDEQRFLAEGIAEDIITQLARNSELAVMARTSTFGLKDQGLGAQEIGEKLGVHYILEGSVRRVEDKLRINAQLIEASSGDHVWAERYDIGASAIYEAQDEIVEKIVGTLSSEIRETEKAAILRRPPNDLDVYELTLRGLARKHRLNPKDMRLAREDLLRAVELDPDYAPAWLYLGWVEAIAIVLKWADEPNFPNLQNAIEKVEKAIELDPTLATAYQALGLLRGWEGDAQGALWAARRSVELGPGNADNILYLARALGSVGDFEQAITYVRQAIALNPTRPAHYDYYLARSLWGMDEFEEINRASNECLTKTPRLTICRVFQIVSYSGMGRSAEASKAVSAVLEQTPSFTVKDALRSAGFPGAPTANEKLAKQLIEAGLPTGENTPKSH